MINLFDADFLHILFNPNARAADKGTVVDRAQDRIDFLVRTISERRDKIILPTPALAEFLLLAADERNEYLTLIRRKSVFEIAGFDDAEAVELADNWLKRSTKKLKAHSPETWAKLKYDRQILAIAVTRRVECIYSTDEGVQKLAAEVGITPVGLKDLPLPPPVQMHFEDAHAKEQSSNVVNFAPTEVQGSSGGSSEGQTTTEASEQATEKEKPTKEAGGLEGGS